MVVSSQLIFLNLKTHISARVLSPTQALSINFHGFCFFNFQVSLKFSFYGFPFLFSLLCRCRWHWLHCWPRCIRLAKAEGGEEEEVQLFESEQIPPQLGPEIKEIQLTISEKYILQDLRNALLEYTWNTFLRNTLRNTRLKNTLSKIHI